MAKMKTYTIEEITDKYIGKIGTPKRDKFEADLKEETSSLPHRRSYQAGKKSPQLDARATWGENRSAESTNLPFGKRQKCNHHLHDAGIQSNEHYRHPGSKRSRKSCFVLSPTGVPIKELKRACRKSPGTLSFLLFDIVHKCCT